VSCSRPSVCEEIGFCDCEDRDWMYSTPEERITLPAIDYDAERRWENGEEWHRDALADQVLSEYLGDELESDDDVCVHDEAAQ